MINKIRAFVMDVDGTMTDGKIYIGENGELMKAFSVKDGQGIALLREAGIKTAIVTARSSGIVQKRADELKIDVVLQGIKDKADAINILCKQFSITVEEIAYIGDDLPDLSAIKLSGLSFCPSDAVDDVKKEVTYIVKSKGGEGAIRDAVNILLS